MSSPSDETCVATALEKPGLVKRLRSLIKQFKRDLREPLPGLADKPLPRRILGRFRHLFKRYGFKLVVVIFMYYLIRDTILYIIIPYFIARQFIG
jgi:CRP-like cAMP-binding protein